MATNPFEDSRVAAGTLNRGGLKPAVEDLSGPESKAICRDDERDGARRATGRRIVAASALAGTRVTNPGGERLATIEEIMIGIPSGCVNYAVLSSDGSFFTVPWSALKFDREEPGFILDADRAALENWPAFDQSQAIPWH